MPNSIRWINYQNAIYKPRCLKKLAKLQNVLPESLENLYFWDHLRSILYFGRNLATRTYGKKAKGNAQQSFEGVLPILSLFQEFLL